MLFFLAESSVDRPAKFAGTRGNNNNGSGSRQSWKKWVFLRFSYEIELILNK